MRKVWLCIFYALCIFTIVFSLFWMALPRLPFPADSGTETPASEPGLAAQGRAGQGSTDFYLCDEGGRVVVYTCTENGLPDKRLRQPSARGRRHPAQAGLLRLRGDRPAGAAGGPRRISKKPDRLRTVRLFASFIRLRAVPAG